MAQGEGVSIRWVFVLSVLCLASWVRMLTLTLEHSGVSSEANPVCDGASEVKAKVPLVQRAHEIFSENVERITESYQVPRIANPDANEFYQYVVECRPVIITGAGACTKHHWTLDYIRQVAGQDSVFVETSQNNRFYNNTGLTKQRMTVAAFLDVFMSPDRKQDYYLAEQGLYQCPALLEDVAVPEFADFMNVDRTQIWIGAGGQVSPLHHDHWDNILCQIEGKRSFTVFSPFQTAFLYPQGEDMYFSQLDPAAPDLQRFPDFTHATPVHVELEAGDMLFLPAFWWHQVHHAAMRNIAVNFWFYPNEISSAFLKALLQRLNGADPEQGADPEHDG